MLIQAVHLLFKFLSNCLYQQFNKEMYFTVVLRFVPIVYVFITEHQTLLANFVCNHALDMYTHFKLVNF